MCCKPQLALEGDGYSGTQQRPDWHVFTLYRSPAAYNGYFPACAVEPHCTLCQARHTKCVSLSANWKRHIGQVRWLYSHWRMQPSQKRWAQGRCSSLVLRLKRSMQMWHSLSTSVRPAAPCIGQQHPQAFQGYDKPPSQCHCATVEAVWR